MENQINIIIADDHPLFRRGLVDLIKSHAQFHIVGEAENGEIGLRMIEERNPAIAIIDLEMPKLHGFEVIKEVKKQQIQLDVIFLTMHNGEDVLEEALDLGCKGFILKECATDDIIECLHTVATGGYYLSPLVSSFLINRNTRMKTFLGKHPDFLLLTPAEKRILKLVSENKTSRTIAEELFICCKTVESHRSNIAHKLNLHGSHELLKFAIENKSFL